MLNIHQAGDLITVTGPGPLPHLAASIAALAGTVTMAPADAEIKARLAEALDRAAGYHERLEEMVAQADESAGVIRDLHEALAQAEARAKDAEADAGGQALERARAELAEAEQRIAELNVEIERMSEIVDRYQLSAADTDKRFSQIKGEIEAIRHEVEELRPLFEGAEGFEAWGAWRVVREAINQIRHDRLTIAGLEAHKAQQARLIETYRAQLADRPAQAFEAALERHADAEGLVDVEALNREGTANYVAGLNERIAELEAKLEAASEFEAERTKRIQAQGDLIKAYQVATGAIAGNVAHAESYIKDPGKHPRFYHHDGPPVIVETPGAVVLTAPAVTLGEEPVERRPAREIHEELEAEEAAGVAERAPAFAELGLTEGQAIRHFTQAGREVLLMATEPDRHKAPEADLVVRVYTQEGQALGLVYRLPTGWIVTLDREIAVVGMDMSAHAPTLSEGADRLFDLAVAALTAPAPALAPAAAWVKAPGHSYAPIWTPGSGHAWKVIALPAALEGAAPGVHLSQIQSHKGTVLGLIHRVDGGGVWLEPNNGKASTGEIVRVSGSEHAVALLAGKADRHAAGKWVAMGLGPNALAGEVIAAHEDKDGRIAGYRIRTAEGLEVLVGLWGLRATSSPAEDAAHEARMAEARARAKEEAAEREARKADKAAAGKDKPELVIVPTEGALELYKAGEYWKAIQFDGDAKAAIARARKNYNHYKITIQEAPPSSAAPAELEAPTPPAPSNPTPDELAGEAEVDALELSEAGMWPAGVSREDYQAWKAGEEAQVAADREDAEMAPEEPLEEGELVTSARLVDGERVIESAIPVGGPRGSILPGFKFEPIATAAGVELQMFKVHPPAGYVSAIDLFDPTDLPPVRVGQVFETEGDHANRWIAEAPGTAGHVAVTRHPNVNLAIGALVKAGGYDVPAEEPGHPGLPAGHMEAVDRMAAGEYEPGDGAKIVGGSAETVSTFVALMADLYGLEWFPVKEALEAAAMPSDGEAEVDAEAAVQAVIAAGLLGDEALDRLEAEVDAEMAAEGALPPAGMYEDAVAAHTAHADDPTITEDPYEPPALPENLVELEDVGSTYPAALMRLNSAIYEPGDGALVFGTEGASKAQARYTLVEVLNVPEEVADVLLVEFKAGVDTERLARMVAHRNAAPAPAAVTTAYTATEGADPSALLNDADRVVLWETASKDYGIQYREYQTMLRDKFGAESSHVLTYAQRDELLAVHFPAHKAAAHA